MKKLEYPILIFIGLIAFGSIFYAWSLKAKAHFSKPLAVEKANSRGSDMAVVGAPNRALAQQPTNPSLPADGEMAPVPVNANDTAPVPTPLPVEYSLAAPTPVPDSGTAPVAPTPLQ